MSAVLYVKLEDAHAAIDSMAAHIPDSSLIVMATKLTLTTKVDTTAMNFDTHNRILDAALRAAFGVKS